MTKQADIDELFDEVLRLRKLVYDAWWDGHSQGEEDASAFLYGRRSQALDWEDSETFKELNRKPVK